MASINRDKKVPNNRARTVRSSMREGRSGLHDPASYDKRGWYMGPAGYGRFDPDTYDFDAEGDHYEATRGLSNEEQTQHYWGYKAWQRMKGMGNKAGAVSKIDWDDDDEENFDQHVIDPTVNRDGDYKRAYIVGEMNSRGYHGKKVLWNGQEFVNQYFEKEGQSLKRHEAMFDTTEIMAEFSKACLWVAENNTDNPKDLGNIIDLKIAQYKF